MDMTKGAGIQHNMLPFNGNFVGSDGEIHNLDELVGGGPGPSPTPSGDGWQPPSDWWDIKTMVDTGVLEWSGQAVENVRYGFIVSDGANTTRLAAGAGYEYYLSDGSYYAGVSTVTHTWDRSKDKPCSEGYKTRAVIVVKATDRDIVINQRAFATDGILSLYVYLGDCNLRNLIFGHSSQSNANTSLIALEHNNLTDGDFYLLVSASAFSYCVGLKHVSFPRGYTLNGNYALRYCYNLNYLTLPDSVNQIGEGALNYLLGLKTLTLHATKISQTTAQSGVYLRDAFGLTAINIPIGFESPVNISTSPSVSVSSLEQLITNAADMTGENTITFTLGATNIAKLSPEYLQLAADKNITLA